MTQDFQDISIDVNPEIQIDLKLVGEEKTPVLIIDNFSLDNQAIIDYACEHSEFGSDNATAYPGIRSMLTRQYVVDVLKVVYPYLYKVYSIPLHLKLKTQARYYSILSKAENELQSSQRVPHVDSPSPYYFAILHYLNEGEFCDTGFFRHKPTGFEKVYAARTNEYYAKRESFFNEHGEPEAKYINQSSEQYELYDKIEYKANRLVAYPGCLLHSALVDPKRDLNPDPRTGRLTANIFVDFQ